MIDAADAETAVDVGARDTDADEEETAVDANLAQAQTF